MSASKRPSTSSLRRFITSRPYVTVAELRRRFGIEDPDAMARIQRNGTAAWIGLPEREASKLQDLWEREELGMELSVEVRAPVVVGVYPMRIARYVMDGVSNGHAPHANGGVPVNGTVARNGGVTANDRSPRNGLPENGAPVVSNRGAPASRAAVPAGRRGMPSASNASSPNDGPRPLFDQRSRDPGPPTTSAE